MPSLNKKSYLIITIITFLIGILYYAWLEEWIIIRHPWWHTYQYESIANAFSKKKTTICIWQNNQWLQEQNDTIWSETDETENAKQLAQAALTLLFEEEAIKKKIYVEAVLKTADNTEFIIIFDRNPFSKQMSIRTKHLIIESILKTLLINNIKTSNIRFLINHQPIIDPHIDLSQSWPLDGFLSR